jgi:spore maturation protein CgeB
VRLFEAGACGVAIISDWWEGLDTLLTPGREILIAERPDDVLRYLRDTSPGERREIGRRGREKILSAHTAAHRAAELERHLHEVRICRGLLQ